MEVSALLPHRTNEYTFITIGAEPFSPFVQGWRAPMTDSWENAPLDSWEQAVPAAGAPASWDDWSKHSPLKVEVGCGVCWWRLNGAAVASAVY